MNKKSVLSLGLVALASLSFSLSAHSASESAYEGAPSWSDTEKEDTAPASSESPRYRPNRRASVATAYRNRGVTPFAPGSQNIALHLGQVFLAGDLTKYQDNLGTELSYTYGVSDIFGFHSSFMYSSHSNKDFSILGLNTGLRVNFSWFDKIVPYGVVGLGFYHPRHKIPSGGVASGTVFGLNVGPGVDLIINQNFFFGASLIFHDMFSKTVATSEGQKDIGGNFTRFMVHAGFTL